MRLGGHRSAHFLERVEDDRRGLLNALLYRHGVSPGSHILHPLMKHRLGKHGSGGSAIAGDIIGLGGHLLDQLRPDVLEGLLQFDLLGYGDAIVGDGRRSEPFIQHYIAPLGAKSDLNRIGKGIHTNLEMSPCILIVRYLFCHFPSLIS